MPVSGAAAPGKSRVYWKGWVGQGGQRGTGTGTHREQSTHRFLVGSLRSRARGARGPPGR